MCILNMSLTCFVKEKVFFVQESSLPVLEFL